MDFGICKVISLSLILTDICSHLSAYERIKSMVLLLEVVWIGILGHLFQYDNFQIVVCFITICISILFENLNFNT